MKTFLSFFIFTFFYSNVFPQVNDVNNYRDKEPRNIMMNSHDSNLKLFPEKSFYKQKEDWQYIIDTTWGHGLPLSQKQQIFNTFTSSLDNSFDGFLSLGMTLSSWDSLKNFYYSKIDSTTSRGRFCAIMNYLCSKLRDGHTYADDKGVLSTPLNPGIPLLVTHGMVNTRHLGAVTTVLSDSSVLILRVIDNHPLNLEPGDIILGYEGVPWKDLIVELMEAGLPNYDWWGGYAGTFTDNLFICAGMNWHLFDTMDVLKYSTGDRAHLPVAPLINLNAPSMLNNEQMEIPNIPFPNYFNGQYVSYGILTNTNIGYIYVLSETGSGNSQFDQAVASLQNTDALIIDMRWNEGGITSWSGAFNILANESFPTLEFAKRCNTTNFNLCPDGNVSLCSVNGSPATKYERPIAVLLGPTCISTGDRNAYRLKYFYNVRTFGKPTWGTPGWDIDFSNSTWYLRHSTGDAFHINNPSYYLQRSEYPIDSPVWHNPDDVAQGKDAVVDKALDWINNLVYPHNTITDKLAYSPDVDSVHLSTIIENPNSHQLSARAYLKTLGGVLIDSVDLVHQLLNPESEQWATNLNLPPGEEFYKISVTAFDQTSSTAFTLPNATRFTTAGPLVVDSLLFVHLPTFKRFSIKPYLTNYGNSLSISGVTVKINCNDSGIINFSGGATIIYPIIPAGATVISNSVCSISYDSTFKSDSLHLNFEIMSNMWPYWKDSIQVIIPPVGVEDEINKIPSEFMLSQNYPNPFNSTSVIKYSIPKLSQVSLKIFNVLGSEIETLVDEEKIVGTYELNWNAAKLPSGVYFYRLQAGDFVQTRKMILLK